MITKHFIDGYYIMPDDKDFEKSMFFTKVEQAIKAVTQICSGKKYKYRECTFQMFKSVYVCSEPEFGLKIHNKGDYERLGNKYNMYTEKRAIQDYNYIEYNGDCNFEIAYNKCLEMSRLLGAIFNQEITLMVYNGYVYNLRYMYKYVENRGNKSWENDAMTKKFQYGIKKHSKKGAEKSQSITQKILGIRGY